jgi:branched-chain amino acid transport system ATP-binding protein
MTVGNADAAPAAEVPADPPLAVEGVSKSFGAVRAVSGVSFAVEPGSLTCLIGPNGAGKSTLLHCVSGRRRADEGRIRLEGADVSRLPAHRRARRGLASVFQSARPLESLDVLANAMLGAHAWTRTEFTAAIFRLPRHRREEREITDAARQALELVGLHTRAHDPAAALPFGQLRLLTVARALAQRPRVLLLDEPAAGLRAAEKRRLIEVLAGLRDSGLTQILVEHDMQFVGALADRVLVLNYGELIADGTPQQIRRDERVRAAYLGSGSRR